jgi:hypothetical protein
MYRVFGMFGMAALFLLISPNLRLTVTGGFESGVNSMEVNAPYSYIGAGVAVLITGAIVLIRGSRPRTR